MEKGSQVRLAAQALVAIFLLVGCNKPNTIKLQDPFLDSFKGKGIKRVVSYDSKITEISDTSILDKHGNIIEKIEYGLTLKMAYDSADFPIRMLFLNDAPNNFLIDYEVDNTQHRIIQRWRTIHSLDWNPSEGNIDSTLFNVVVFEFNDGAVTSKKDSLANETTRYFYTSDKHLIRQEKVGEKGEVRGSISYEYAPNGELVLIHSKIGGLDFYRHHFTNGLLDSTEFLNPSNRYIRKYKYEFN